MLLSLQQAWVRVGALGSMGYAVTRGWMSQICLTMFGYAFGCVPAASAGVILFQLVG